VASFKKKSVRGNFLGANVLKVLIECLMVVKFYQTGLNTIKQHQTRCTNGKIAKHFPFVQGFNCGGKFALGGFLES